MTEPIKRRINIINFRNTPISNMHLSQFLSRLSQVFKWHSLFVTHSLFCRGASTALLPFYNPRFYYKTAKPDICFRINSFSTSIRCCDSNNSNNNISYSNNNNNNNNNNENNNKNDNKNDPRLPLI